MNDGNTRNINCPQHGCKHKISYEEVMQVSDVATRKKFEDFVSKQKKSSEIVLTLFVAAAAGDTERRRVGGVVSQGKLRDGHVCARRADAHLSLGKVSLHLLPQVFGGVARRRLVRAVQAVAGKRRNGVVLFLFLKLFQIENGQADARFDEWRKANTKVRCCFSLVVVS